MVCIYLIEIVNEMVIGGVEVAGCSWRTLGRDAHSSNERVPQGIVPVLR